jgi:hypothetical protein
MPCILRMLVLIHNCRELFLYRDHSLPTAPTIGQNVNFYSNMEYTYLTSLSLAHSIITTSDDSMINEKWSERDIEGSGRDLF